MLTIKRILCPTDFSEPSRLALEGAAGLARQLDAELHVVHVISPGQVPAAAFDLMYPVPEDVLIRAAEEHLQAVVRDLVGRGVRATAQLAHGNAGHEIVRIARDERFDVIVMASQGQGRVEQLLFGSVAERVVRLADCPVLSIPAHRR